eukprot:3561325-Rhodomonas_salina.3
MSNLSAARRSAGAANVPTVLPASYLPNSVPFCRHALGQHQPQICPKRNRSPETGVNARQRCRNTGALKGDRVLGTCRSVRASRMLFERSSSTPHRAW